MKTGATVEKKGLSGVKWFKAAVDALYTHWKNRGPLTYCCRPKAYLSPYIWLQKLAFITLFYQTFFYSNFLLRQNDYAKAHVI
jgi:hypothetical protein